MKKLLFLFSFLGSLGVLNAQCPPPHSQIDIHGNRIKARILNGGGLFTDFTEGQFLPAYDPNASSNPATIYCAGIWMGGLDPAGNIKLATVDYRSNSLSDYSAGPLSEDGTTIASACQNWDRLFRVTGEEIRAFLNDLPMSQSQAIALYPDIMGWPGKGNNTFTEIWGFDLPFSTQPLAPFYDANDNGQYDPLAGDYPAVQLRNKPLFVPAEMVWCVFNDQNADAPHSNSKGKPLQVELQLTAWAFNCSEFPVLNNTIFTSHKIINRAPERLDSTFIALWADIDLGCYFDDYIGCNPALKTVFAYNQDPVDGQPGASCSGTPTFDTMPPVQTITFLDQPFSKFISYNNGSVGNPLSGTLDPQTVYEVYNYLTGSWRDGTPLTYGGSGFQGAVPTDYAFPDDPENPDGWSMCSASLPFSDRRVLASSKVGEMLPGQVEEFNTAWAVHYDAPPPCNLGNAMDEVALLHTLFDGGFNNACTPLAAPVPVADLVELFPNPVSGMATLRYGSLYPQEIRLTDATGKIVQILKNLPAGETALHLENVPAGIYTIQIFCAEGNLTKKLAVSR